MGLGFRPDSGKMWQCEFLISLRKAQKIYSENMLPSLCPQVTLHCTGLIFGDRHSKCGKLENTHEP